MTCSARSLGSPSSSAANRSSSRSTVPRGRGRRRGGPAGPRSDGSGAAQCGGGGPVGRHARGGVDGRDDLCRLGRVVGDERALGEEQAGGGEREVVGGACRQPFERAGHV